MSAEFVPGAFISRGASVSSLCCLPDMPPPGSSPEACSAKPKKDPEQCPGLKVSSGTSGTLKQVGLALGLEQSAGRALAWQGSSCPIGVHAGERLSLPAEPCLGLSISRRDQMGEENRVRTVARAERNLLALKLRFHGNGEIRVKGRLPLGFRLSHGGTLPPHIGTTCRRNRVNSHDLTPHCFRMARPRLPHLKRRNHRATLTSC